MEERNMRRIGILTSGGDCQALNATMRGVAKSLYNMLDDVEIIGFEDGYKGLMYADYHIMKPSDFSGILTQGGTILGTSRQPFKQMRVPDENGLDKVESMKHTYRKLKLSCLVVLGGNGSQKTANLLSEEGLNVVSLPKTIDNDLGATDVTFGFYSAVSIVSESLDRLETTANAHQRMMVVEVMGRHAGWIALEGGIAGSADVILLPEIPFSLENVVECIKARKAAGQREILVVVSEGARLADELVLLDEKTQGEVRLGGIGKVIAKKLEEATGIETRSCVLGHIQRGGSPCSYDRILGTRFGSYAVELVEKRQFSCMVALRGTQMTAVPIEEAVKTLKLVDPDCQLVRTARDLGVCFGD